MFLLSEVACGFVWRLGRCDCVVVWVGVYLFFFFLPMYQYMTVRQRAWSHFSGVLVLVCFYFGVALIAFLGSISIGHTWFLTGCVLMAGWWLSWKWSGRRRRREKTTHPAAVRTSRAKVSFAYAPKSCLSPGSIVIVTNSKPVLKQKFPWHEVKLFHGHGYRSCLAWYISLIACA